MFITDLDKLVVGTDYCIVPEYRIWVKNWVIDSGFEGVYLGKKDNQIHLFGVYNPYYYCTDIVSVEEFQIKVIYPNYKKHSLLTS
jgi:hypothetical protein